MNDQREYKCVDEEGIPGDYHKLSNFGSLKIFYVNHHHRMEEIPKENGYYINQKEYIIVKDDFSYTIDAEPFNEDEECIDHNGYIFYDPEPMICLSFAYKVKVNKEHAGMYLVMYTEPNPFEFSNYTFRSVVISNNKITFAETEEGIYFYNF